MKSCKLVGVKDVIAILRYWERFDMAVFRVRVVCDRSSPISSQSCPRRSSNAGIELGGLQIFRLSHLSFDLLSFFRQIHKELCFKNKTLIIHEIN